nr:hypothetical protein [Tanacetum cinerariifolium]
GKRKQHSESFMLDFKIAVWNIRGMCKGNRHKEVMKFINTENLQMCSIIETHIKGKKIKESLVEKDPYNEEIKKREVEVLVEYNEVMKELENLLAQKAKVEWLNAGDKNSSFFHKVIKGRSRNRVEVICDENGKSYEREEVPLQFLKHFQQFLGNASNVSELAVNDDLFSSIFTNNEAGEMVKEVSDKEIKEAMFDIGDNRASWPNGFSSVFFKKHGILLGKMIKGALKKLVQINQSAFIPDRLIQDNILVSQEILRSYGRKNGSKRCAMKIAVQKAYDTISWSFLETILNGFGFHSKMRIKARAVSPYLFTLVMEVLTLLLQRKIRTNADFKYHHGCKELKVSIGRYYQSYLPPSPQTTNPPITIDYRRHQNQVGLVVATVVTGDGLKREAAEKAFEASKDKDETIKSLEELRFLTLSTKDLSDDDAYWIERKKAQIKAKLRSEMPMEPNNEDDSDE